MIFVGCLGLCEPWLFDSVSLLVVSKDNLPHSILCPIPAEHHLMFGCGSLPLFPYAAEWSLSADCYAKASVCKHSRLSLIESEGVAYLTWEVFNIGSTLLVGVQTDKPHWKSIWWLLRKFEIILLQDPDIPLLKTYQNETPQGHLLNYAQSSFIHNGQKLETT